MSMIKKITCAALAAFTMSAGVFAAGQQPVNGSSRMEQAAVGQAVQIPSPIKEYKSVQAVANAVGFAPLTLAGNEHYTLIACETIDKMAQLVYKESDVKNNNRLMIRKAAAAELSPRALSGYYSDNWMPVIIGRTVVSVTTDDGVNYAAYWRSGLYSYSVNASEMTGNSFIGTLASLVGQTEAERGY